MELKIGPGNRQSRPVDRFVRQIFGRVAASATEQAYETPPHLFVPDRAVVPALSQPNQESVQDGGVFHFAGHRIEVSLSARG